MGSVFFTWLPEIHMSQQSFQFQFPPKQGAADEVS